jgi:hypothetical protein
MQRKNEIVSFNESVPELSDLLELDTVTLDRVIGGLVVAPTTCESHKGSCAELTSCGTYRTLQDQEQGSF